MEQLISDTRTSLVDTIASLQDSDGGVRPVPEVLEWLTKIHDILDNAVSKRVGNTACTLVSLLILLPGSIIKSDLYSTLSLEF